MLSEDEQKRSRSELRMLIVNINKTKKPIKVKRSPKFRFRTLVRTVLNNIKWLTEDISPDQKAKGKHLILSTKSKGMLRIPPDERTAEDKDALSKVLGHLPCFDRYPESVRGSLSLAATFQFFPPGRVLVAEGHLSMYMYIIISGQVAVKKMEFDPGLKEYKSVEQGLMLAGDTFGEINILHDEPWPTTITTLTHVELLTIKKESFQAILETFLGDQKREITNCLNQFPYFKEWGQKTIVECCILARVVQYDFNDLIVGDQVGNVDNAYFIMSGSCQVIYQMQIEHVPRKKHFTQLRILETVRTTDDETFPSSYTVRNLERPRIRKISTPVVASLIVSKTLQQMFEDLPLRDSRMKAADENTEETQIQTHFMQIAKLLTGACFGIGESLDSKFILSSSHPVTLLSIPKYFLKSHNFGNIWGRLREFFNHSYPSSQTVFSQFIIDRKWNRSRMKYLESLLKAERPFTGLTAAEGPYFTRLTNDLDNPIFRRIKTFKKEKEYVEKKD